MGTDICLLVVLLHEATMTLFRCALRAERDELGDAWPHWVEPGNREKIRNLLPEHVRTLGPVVEVEEIFEIHAAPN